MWNKKCLTKYVKVKVKVLVIQSCLILWNHMDCSPVVSSVHGILQARILEWVTMPSSGRSSWARDWTQLSRTEARFSTLQATRFWKYQSLHPVILLHRIQRKYKIQNSGCNLDKKHLNKNMSPTMHDSLLVLPFKPDSLFSYLCGT